MAAPPPPRALAAEPRRAPLGAVGVSLPRPRGRVRSAQPREEILRGYRQLMSTNYDSRSLLCHPCSCAQTALADTRIAYEPEVDKHTGVLAYDLVQGSLVSIASTCNGIHLRTNQYPIHLQLFSCTVSLGAGKTGVSKQEKYAETFLYLVEGVLKTKLIDQIGCEGSFAKRLAQEFPMWQFLLVDLRCHGDSASIKKRGPHTVASTARDVLKLIVQLRLNPRVLVGHSFGGKVALSMVEQAAKPLARPVRVWVLDATPGKVRAGGDGEDHPAELIEFLRRMPAQ
ncbi:hypothetical protein EJB05_18197, partial [Eragrostis curvula]